ncbi:hypothetical protein BDZ97DRAFT_1911505 [Flammula alnicola]|nr:hypothetical protein BDZ97DRAFT_1911505 [Flammula alnicola]
MSSTSTQGTFRRDAFNLVAVEILFLGLYSGIFFFALYSTWYGKLRSSLRQKIWKTTIITATFTFSSIHCGVTWWFAANQFDVSGGTPNFMTSFVEEQPVWFVALGSFAFMCNILIADSVAAWRCWILSDKRWIWVAFPILCIISSLATAIAALTFHTTIQLHPPPGAELLPKEDTFKTLFVVYISLSLAATLYSTSVIVGRMAITYRAVSGVHSSINFPHVVHAITESALIYATMHIITLALLEQASIPFTYAQNIMAQLTGIAPTLLIIRTSTGYTQPPPTTGEVKTASIRFQVSDSSTSEAASDSEQV